MAERSRENDGDATSSGGDKYNTVFIDTNLDTHLAIIVSDTDTVLHLKQKIMKEHPECFPELGKIKINALKMKWKGIFYHMSDTVLVKSAFQWSKKCWFLSVDVSTVVQPNENQMPKKTEVTNQLALICFTKTTSGDSSNHLANNSSNKIVNNCGPGYSCNEAQKMDFKNVSANDSSRVCSDLNGAFDYKSKAQEQLSERLVVSEINAKLKGVDSQVGVDGNHCNYPLEESIRNEPDVSKKRKSKKKDKTEVSNFTVKNDDIDFDDHSSGKTRPKIPNNTEVKNVNACNKVSEANANQENGDFQIGVDYQCNVPPRGSLRSGTRANKKHKSKKKTEDSLSNCTAKDDYIDIDKHSSDKTVREVPVDVEMANTDAVKGPCSASLDDTDLRFLKTTVPTKNDESKDLVCDTQGNAPPDASNSIPATRKRKRKKSTQADNPQEEDNNETPMENDKVPKSSVIIKEKNTTASTENLITETPKDVDLVADTSSKKSKRRKKRSTRDQEVFADPPSSHMAGEEFFFEDLETVATNVTKENGKNLAQIMDQASNSAIVSKSDSQLAVPYSTIGVDVMEYDVPIAKVKTVAPELDPERGSKGTKKSKKRHSTNLNELPPPVVSELDNMKENAVLSVGKNFVRDDDGIKINGPDIVKKQKDSLHNRVTEKKVSENCEQPVHSEIEGSHNVAETNRNVEHGKSPGGIRLKKTAKKPVSQKVVLSSAEYSNNSVKEFSTIAPHDLSVEAMKLRSPLSQTKISEPTLLNISLVEANGEGNNRLSKSEEESRESEEFVQKNYGVEAETNSRVKKKETRMDFPQEKSTRKSTGVSAAKSRQKKSRSEKGSQENEEIVSKIHEKETDRNFRVEEKVNKSNIAQQLIAGITTKDTGVSAAKPRKKMKKIQSSTGETHSALPIKEQNLSNEELILSNHVIKEAEEASKIEKLGKSSKNQSTGKKLEPKKNIADEHGSLTLAADLTLAPSSGTHRGSIERPIEHVDGRVCHNPNVSDTNNIVDVSKDKDDGINFKEYFCPQGSDRGRPPVQSVVSVLQKLKTSDMPVKSKRSTQVSLGNGSERKSHPRNSTDFEHKDAKISTLGAKKEIEQKLSPVNNRSTTAKLSSKRMGVVVNSSPREKSLLATPASIFRDQSSESSEYSNTSTKAPSDNSSSSSDSEEEGADSARGADFRSIKEPKTPHQRIDMDMILRSSSRYKQAKLSAVQSQLEDTENQPVDFVPESEPIQ